MKKKPERPGEEHEFDDQDEPPPKKSRKEFVQFPRSPAAPLIPCGEDKVSHDRHVKILHLEERKVAPNLKVISYLMRKTYPFRRKEILEHPKPIEELLETYPALKRCEQVCICFNKFEKRACMVTK